MYNSTIGPDEEDQGRVPWRGDIWVEIWRLRQEGWVDGMHKNPEAGENMEDRRGPKSHREEKAA